LKHRAETPPLRRSPSKSARTSKGSDKKDAKLELLSAHFAAFNQTFAQAIVSSGPGSLLAIPERRSRASELMQQQEDHLTPEQQVDLIELFAVDVAAADMYRTLKNPVLRSVWVNCCLHDIAQKRSFQEMQMTQMTSFGSNGMY
jgi:hypothetical protein